MHANNRIPGSDSNIRMPKQSRRGVEVARSARLGLNMLSPNQEVVSTARDLSGEVKVAGRGAEKEICSSIRRVAGVV